MNLSAYGSSPTPSSMDPLASQLTRQLDYSNALLAQVQVLEADQLALRRELMQYQGQGQAAAIEVERLRGENDELRKKAGWLQGLTETLSAQAKESRMEATRARADAEAAVRDSAGCRALLERASVERSALQKEVLALGASARAAAEEAEGRQREAQAQLEIMKRMNDSLSAEVAEGRARIGSLEAERSSAQLQAK